MGAVISTLTSPRYPLIENADGNLLDYHDDFIEGTILGQGQFGIVKEVYPNRDISSHSVNTLPYRFAVKKLQKGMTMKSNVIYSPLHPEVLQRECDILRLLSGSNYTMKLEAVYESHEMIYFITESFDGGHLLEWTKSKRSNLDQEHFSRISYQLLTAINHCANHGVIHRDIKPENIMFVHTGDESDLRLIDFGSSAKDEYHRPNEDNKLLHKTMAGTPFYTSPEMFQQRYSYETDVWSVGVVLYVLVADYPKKDLQIAFDILHTRNDRNLHQLPNLLDHLPASYFDLLENLLTYKRIERGLASSHLDAEFLNFKSEGSQMK